MSYHLPSSTLSSMNDREFAALQRATKKLRASQFQPHQKPDPEPVYKTTSGIKGIHHVSKSGRWRVHYKGKNYSTHDTIEEAQAVLNAIIEKDRGIA